MTGDESPIFPIPDGQWMNESGQMAPVFKHVSFRFEAVENPGASAREGRKVFDRVLVARLHYPGGKDTLDKHLKRWAEGGDTFEVVDAAFWESPGVAERAEAFEAKQGDALAGTPLALLNLDVVTLAELRAAGVATVEALSGVPDAALKNLSGGRGMRAKAQAFLAAQRDAAPLLAAKAEAEAARERDRATQDELKELRAELARLRAAQPDPARRRAKQEA